MRISILVLSLLALSLTCKAQDEVTPVIKLTLLSPGIAYEHPLGRHQTLHLQGMFTPSGGLGYSSSVGWLSNLYLDPALALEYRHYFGMKRRLERGKNVALNSGNYLAGLFRTDFPKRYYLNQEGEIDRRRKPVFGLGVVVGMQRNYKGRFSLDLNIGLGHSLEKGYTDPAGESTTHNSQFYLPAKISLGIWLNKHPRS
jgi:hypothetical protein